MGQNNPQQSDEKNDGIMLLQ